MTKKNPSRPTYTLITSCSSTRLVPPVIRGRDLGTGLTMQEALEGWLALLEANPPSITPREQYRGIGFTDLVKIQEAYVVDDIKIVTGGAGLVGLDEPITPYDFSASKSEHENMHQVVTAEPFVQPVWWGMINQARGKTSAPVAKLLEASTSTYFLIACPKIFLRYISDDLLTVIHKYSGKVRILLSASSVTSVPIQLRPYILPFGQSTVMRLPGNRNDGHHRAAMLFMDMVENVEGFREASTSQQQAILNKMYPEQSGSENGVRPPTDLRELIGSRPDLQNLSPEQAYRQVVRERGTVGGRVRFCNIFREVTGQNIEVDVDAADVERAAEALKGLRLGKYQPSHNDLTILHLAAFARALEQTSPDSVVTAADVCAWAEAYFRSRSEPVPKVFQAPARLHYALRTNAPLVGLCETSDNKGYTVRRKGF